MFKLFRFLKKKDIYLTILCFLLFLIHTACDIAQTFLIAYMLTPSGDSFWIFTSEANKIGGYWGLVAIMVSCVAVSLITQSIGIIISAKVGVRLGSNIRLKTFEKIQTLTYKEIDAFSTPSLITRLTNDILFYQNAVTNAIRMAFRSIFIMIGGMIATFVIGAQIGMVWLGAVFSAFLIFASLIIFYLLKSAIPYFRKQQKSMDNTNAAMRENLLGVRVVKAFNLQNQQKKSFDTQNSNLTKASTIANRWATTIMPVVYFVVQIAVVVIIICIADVISSNPDAGYNITVVLEIIQLTNFVVFGFVLIIGVLIMGSYTKVSADRINEIFAAKPSIPRNESNNMIEQGLVEFKNISYKYHDSKEVENALENISFVANPGEMIGIIGPTGSGKTTLVNLITRTLEVTSGELKISGHNVKDINYESLRNQIGISPQKSLILSGTIASNLKFGKEDATIEEMQTACDLAQASEFIKEKEGQFDAVVEQRGTNFSGGQKQRISIARALIKKPKILILDDSTSALDMITEAKVQDAIRNYTDTTIFLVGQRVNAISKADKIIVLEDGKMVGYGNHLHLLKNCKLYKDIAISQGFDK